MGYKLNYSLFRIVAEMDVIFVIFFKAKNPELTDPNTTMGKNLLNTKYQNTVLNKPEEIRWRRVD